METGFCLERGIRVVLKRGIGIVLERGRLRSFWNASFFFGFCDMCFLVLFF